MAKSPTALVTARTVPELVHQVQTLPLRSVIVDAEWPRTIWTQLLALLRDTQPALPVLALTTGPSEDEWWRVADDLLRLDEPLELFLYRLERHDADARPAMMPTEAPVAQRSMPPRMTAAPVALATTPSLLENSQFRQFTAILSGADEPAIIEAFVGWAQQACQASRTVILLRDPATGDFACRAHRGLPSTLVPHCIFQQTAPICRWLVAAGHILLKDDPAVAMDVVSGLDLMQAVVAVPIIFDGQLVGILGLGPRVVGAAYSVMELEGLFALGGQIAMAIHHHRMHKALRTQQEMTEHMLGVMPTGTVVLAADHRIAFANAAAAAMLGQPRTALEGLDLRALPTPLGDWAFEALTRGADLPRREVALPVSGRPLAATAFALATTPASSLLVLEDLSAQRQLEAEHERRLNLEVVTNLVHYLAHELRNPLVALSTFNNLVTSHAGDRDFQEFCETVLHGEIGRINLILEQLLVLTNHAEFQFGEVPIGTIIRQIAQTEDLQARVASTIPDDLPNLYGDSHRLETAFACLYRTLAHLATGEVQARLSVEVDEQHITLRGEAPQDASITPEWLLNPWQQLMGGPESHVDFGLATAQFILEQHGGSLAVSVTNGRLVILCRVPLRLLPAGQGDIHNGARESTRRR
jgi:nitrogen-specific signal transduction histidine kinase